MGHLARKIRKIKLRINDDTFATTRNSNYHKYYASNIIKWILKQTVGKPQKEQEKTSKTY